MAEPRKAKLFENGASQAVMLPAEFRFEGDEVYIARDEKSQNVILSDPAWSPLNRISLQGEDTLFREDDLIGALLKGKFIASPTIISYIL